MWWVIESTIVDDFLGLFNSPGHPSMSVTDLSPVGTAQHREGGAKNPILKHGFISLWLFSFSARTGCEEVVLQSRSDTRPRIVHHPSNAPFVLSICIMDWGSHHGRFVPQCLAPPSVKG